MAKKIVLVEDDDIIANALEGELRDAGFQALRARDGREGLALVLKEQPDLILLDIVMPQVDGIAMLDKLREDEWGERASVIVLTNLADNEQVARALELGAHTYLVKSNISVDGAVEKIRAYLQ